MRKKLSFSLGLVEVLVHGSCCSNIEQGSSLSFSYLVCLVWWFMNERELSYCIQLFIFWCKIVGQHRRERFKIRLRSKNKNLKNTSLLGILLPKSNWRRQKCFILSLTFCGAIISIQYMIAHRHIASQGEKTLHLHNILYSVDKCKHCAVRTEMYSFHYLSTARIIFWWAHRKCIKNLWLPETVHKLLELLTPLLPAPTGSLISAARMRYQRLTRGE